MGKVTRKAQEKHKVSLTLAVSDVVNQLTTVPYADLPSVLAKWPQAWPFPRGDLNNWIEALDRFDDILQSFNSKYGLDKGPQTVPFGSTLLLEGSPGIDEKGLKERGFSPEGDRELVEAILAFSKLLVDKCANRAVYNSTDRLNDLLNTTSLSLLHSTLRIAFALAQRYAGMRPPAHHAGNFYDLDLERLQKLALPLGQPPASSAAGKRGPPSPVKVKSKEKTLPGGKARRGSVAVSPNDFRSLCRDAPQAKSSTAAPDRDWSAWAHVKVSWSSTVSEQKPTPAEASQSSEPPSSPTPTRHAPGPSPASTAASPNENGHRSVAPAAEPSMKHIEFSASDLASSSIEVILRDNQPDDMPPKVRYELLHQLRVAYGLAASGKTRKQLLEIRLLAVACLANVCSEPDLSQKLFSVEKPQEFIQQLVTLLHDTKKGHTAVPTSLQTLAMWTMSFLAHSKFCASEISTALGAGSSQGLLSQLIQKGLVDIANDNDATDNLAGDEWREATFTIPRTLIEVAGHHGRSSEVAVANSFIKSYLSGLGVYTGKAMKVHLRILDFMKTFFHHFKDGLAALLAADAFEALSNLVGSLVTSAWDLLRAGEGIPERQKTRITDYDIPYLHQQIIRSVIDMINDISGHQGAQADRVLRSLVDSQALLRAFRLIVDQLSAFGAHTWSEVIKAICGFLHNEPTSYTVIFEAGIIQSILNTVNPPQDSAEAPTEMSSKSISSAPKHKPQGIPPVVDAIVNVSQVFGGICLTNAGFELFKGSGALEKFFEIFESPAHVTVLSDGNILALLGSTFDELVRHHPNLRSSVLSAVMVMLARVRHISRSLSVNYGAGPKLFLGSKDGLETEPCGGREALSLEILPPLRTNDDGPPRQRRIELPNSHSLTLEDEVLPPSMPKAAPSDKDDNGLKASDYARPAIAFLMTFFEHQAHCTNFLEHGGCDLVLDFITLPSMPVASEPFRNGGLYQELSSAVHMMAECKPQIVLPALVDRARFACSELKHFSQSQPMDWSCYFQPLIKTSATTDGTGKSPAPELSEVELNGTRIVRSMMAVFCLAQVFSEVFHIPIYNQRHMQNLLFTMVNLEDVFADIARMMGAISAACCREDVALQRSIPESWLSATRPDHFSTGNDEVDKLLSIRDSGARVTGQSTPQTGEVAPSSQQDTSDLSVETQTAYFKNVQTLRFLLIETPAAITEFLCRLGRIIAARRRPDTFAKQKTTIVANALATAYLTQLQPYFLGANGAGEAGHENTEPRFTYLVVTLDNIRRCFYDDSSSSSGPITTHAIRQGYVVEAFRKAGGVQTLTKVGTEFFDKLKSCKVEHSTFSANTGLKICLDILDDFTDAKCIMDSAQSNNMKNTDPSRPYYFVPAQVLLNLRMGALPLTRLIWESEYADQASKNVVQKLVSILKHVLNGDHENEAVQTDSGHPTLPPFTWRKLPNALDPSKVNALKEKGYDEDLVREALYRSNSQAPNNYAPAEDYCRALTGSTRRRRLPVPDREGDPSGISSAQSALQIGAWPGGPPDGPPDGTPAETRPTEEDNEMEDVDDSGDDAEMATGHTSRPRETAAADGTPATENSNLVNNESEPSHREPQPLQAKSPLSYSVESMFVERAIVREDLAERCNNILNNHQSLTFELSDLIISATSKLSDDLTKEYWRTTSDLLTSSLLSMQVEDDITEAQGKKIAAAAHLVALLIQDNEVFDETVAVFQDSFEGLLSFLSLPAANGKSDEGSYPWVAPVLLIIEKMLSKDCEPVVVTWFPPTDLDSSSEPIITPTSVFTAEDKIKLFDSLINLLPRVGKDKGMALAIARALVALTRTRELATRVAEKRNLQRLFLMVKQLANGVGHRLQSSLMLILRHIVEDDDTLRQIMRSEIKALFSTRSSIRNPDTNAYVRELYHLAIRSPSIFVEATNETVKLAQWQPQSGGVASVVLKKTSPAQSDDEGQDEQLRPQDGAVDSAAQPATSIGAPQATLEEAGKPKAPEMRPPVVEHPDGVIHFILSELLNYKDVEDKEVSPQASSSTGTTNGSADQAPQDASGASEGTVSDNTRPKPEKAKFKPEEHPIFSYRCFLMYSLTELLHSYNRTKVEFINFSRKADPMAGTPSKPRSSILNYFLNGLIPSCHVDKEDSLQFKKKLLTSDWAIRVVVALCSKTGESGTIAPAQRYSTQPQVDDVDNEPDLTFVRKFVLEHAIKAYKDAISSTESLQMKYSRLLCLADMFNRLLTKPAVPEGTAGSQNTSYKVLARMMFEKNLISVLTSSLAEIDLAYPGSRRVVKFILRPLQELTTLASQLTTASPDLTSVVSTMSEDVISSASSVSDVHEEEREETPDLFRNSALGMLDPNRDPDESDSDDDEDDEDEEMYDEEYEDEMEYDNGIVAGGNDDEAVSDEEEEGDMGPEGEIEGLPGDVPMDIEFVVNEQGMDVDTDEEEEEDDDDSDEDEHDEEDEDGDDFEIGDDADAGEINGDDENHSLHDGHEDEEGEWEDEEDEDEDHEGVVPDPVTQLSNDQFDFDGDIMAVEGDGAGRLPAPGVLSNLLRVLGDHDLDGPAGMPHPVPPELIVPAAGSGDPEDEDDDEEDDEDDDEEGEDMDENGEIAFDRDFEILDHADHLMWDHTPMIRRHRPLRGPGGWSFTRRIGGRDDLNPAVRSGRLGPHGRSGGDDGTNPLLRRPQPESRQRPEHTGANIVLPPGLEAALPGMGAFPPLHTTFQTIDGHGTGGHGAVLDAIFQAIQRGEIEGGQVRLRIPTPLTDLRDPWRPSTWDPRHHRHTSREDSQRASNFVPAFTMTRWQEEARLLFGNGYVEKLQRVQVWVMSVLVPPAQQEEKERRRKREEEARAELEEAERLRVEAARRKKEQEEQEEQERLRAEAEAAAAAEARGQEEAHQQDGDGDTDPMEDVQGTGAAAAPDAGLSAASDSAAAEARPRVFTTIRGRQLDITGLDIDVEYLEALPEELREEVIMQQYATRREEAREQGTESHEIDPDFLNALPEEIREEIRQQEAHAQRRREREEARRQAAATGGASAQPEEMDNDNFLATLDPAFRRVILAEQPPEILRQLDPRHAAEGRAHARRLYQYVRGDRDPRDNRHNEDAGGRDSKRQIIQMVDKSGVATLLRLMFLPQGGSLRTNLWHILRNISGNRLTRSEVVHLLLVILKEGSTDVTAVERSLANLSLRAKATASQKTPQPLKRTLSMQPAGRVSEEVTPLVVVEQCLSALKQLCQNNYHTRTLFVREVDSNPTSKKGKGKVKEGKAARYPINDLVGLLDRKLIVESSSCLQSLAELLSTVTQPLPNLLKKDKDKDSDEPKPAGTEASNTATGAASTASDRTAQLAQPDTDVEIRDAPAPAGETEASGSATQPTETTAPAADETANTSNEDLTTEEGKAKKIFDPPEISEHNLQLVVSIFVAPECNSDTFHSTLETLSNLSSIPGTSDVFSKELIHHIQELSESICRDLDELVPQLKEAQSITDLHALSSTKFSHSGSDQVKLLRVLQALDYLSAPKVENEDGAENAVVRSILTSSYDSLGLKPLWTKLSDCLTTVREKENIASFATILLPLIESLMVVCKNTSLKDSMLARQIKEQAPGSPAPEAMDDLQELFFNFTTEHRKILNDIIRQSPKLMQGNGSFSLLVKNPKVLDFDNKRAYFTKLIHSRLHQQRHIQPPLQLNVRRDQVFLDSYKALYYKSAEEMKYGKLNIRFNGEEGVDAGGVTREWFQVLARGMFNPDWALWQPVAADRTTFHPSPLSWINGEHLLYFKFIGRIIGKALHEGRVLDCHFSRAVYKRLLGKEPNLKDLESMDLDYYKSLVWILENDITDVITEDFSVIEEQFGVEKVIDLIPNGRNIPVTEENKREYVNAQVRYRLTTSVKDQIENFVKGFHDIVPAELIAIFDEQELELLISGLPEIDVDDWKAHTEYHNYNGSSPQVIWFWRIVRGMSNEERAKLLQFVTGTSKVPLNGFKDLEGMQGNTLFSIHKDPSQSRLPTSHTCFNQLDLPAYDDYDTLKNNLMTAINLGADYFGFA
ncbi:E3 ubiquitin-protein ligase HUWE1 [Cladophialophora yegresii CBS 114405]|uniref:HECT-type E3 ubiquitin transferase n=1 Tax=Cladophialophora yegresii CBS 114405 TaxID=1182544 RepID=W9WH62_9EURO|nr:E3 ubiquitin-protein ligase HUWE1 [Cladophialophora yegresii CBS 114405]EXJ63936.1 E3 ubiquitin-protein ligase HUWE1 [Cladophialophora yegresii CBS 114405]